MNVFVDWCLEASKGAWVRVETQNLASLHWSLSLTNKRLLQITRTINCADIF